MQLNFIYLFICLFIILKKTTYFFIIFIFLFFLFLFKWE